MLGRSPGSRVAFPHGIVTRNGPQSLGRPHEAREVRTRKGRQPRAEDSAAYRPELA